jgi:hypothetical protein
VTLAARQELGPEHDAQLIAGFLDRIEHELDRRVDERVPAKPAFIAIAFVFGVAEFRR